MVYTPTCGSPEIDFMVYALFGGSTKLKLKPFTTIFYSKVKRITQYIKNELKNISV